MRVLNDRDEIKAAEGTELGVSTWLEVSQERIDMFADATGDHQWIHVDPHKAATGPFGATVAHGYLTLSLIPFLGAQAFAFAGETARVNYGLDRVRFMSPVRVGSRIRDRVVLSKVNEIERGQQVQLTHTIEIEGVEKPACVAEAIVLLMDS